MLTDDLKGLVVFKKSGYFADADADEERAGIKVFEKDFSWGKAKRTIEEKVRAYQFELLSSS